MKNLELVKEAIRKREARTYTDFTTTDEMIELLEEVVYENDLDYYEIFYDLIKLEDLEEMAQREIQEGGIIRLKFFLGQIIDTTMDDNNYVLDGYGNAREVNLGDIQDYLERIEEMLEEAA